jgi:hypothetical protein
MQTHEDLHLIDHKNTCKASVQLRAQSLHAAKAGRRSVLAIVAKLQKPYAAACGQQAKHIQAKPAIQSRLQDQRHC